MGTPATGNPIGHANLTAGDHHVPATFSIGIDHGAAHIRVLTVLCSNGCTHVYRLHNMQEVVHNAFGAIVASCQDTPTVREPR